MNYRDYNAGDLMPVNKSANQEQGANYRNKDGTLCIVRCYACGDSERGRENHMMAVASGYCAWCNWSEEKLNEVDRAE